MSPEPERDEGAGRPPWLGTIGAWFLAAGVLLLLPRQWIPAGAAFLIGIVLSVWASSRGPQAP